MKYIGLKILVALTFVGVIIVNTLANALPINGITTGQISDNYSNLFAPAGLTFSIWGVIYSLLALYTLYQFGLFQKDAGKSNEETFRKVGKLFVINSIANILWILAWHYDYIALTVILMIVLLWTLISIANYLRTQNLSAKDKLFILAPFSIYFGWITVATIANITVYLVSIGWDGFGLVPQFWAIAIILTGAIIGILRFFKDKNLFYPAVFIWAYLGIYIKHSSPAGWDRQYPAVMTTTLICIAVFIVSMYYITRYRKVKTP